MSYECGDGAAVPLRFIREGTLNDSILSPPASFPATPVFALAVSFGMPNTMMKRRVEGRERHGGRRRTDRERG